jgi:hypothetical protein
MVVYESSILENESLEEQNAGFKPVVDALLDPAVEMCLTVSEEKQKARPQWDKQVFVLNCLAYLKVSSTFSRLTAYVSAASYGGCTLAERLRALFIHR